MSQIQSGCAIMRCSMDYGFGVLSNAQEKDS
nr:MAG TPA: hypothetical protein [Caudoviricetes sp.]